MRKKLTFTKKFSDSTIINFFNRFMSWTSPKISTSCVQCCVIRIKSDKENKEHWKFLPRTILYWRPFQRDRIGSGWPLQRSLLLTSSEWTTKSDVEIHPVVFPHPQRSCCTWRSRTAKRKCIPKWWTVQDYIILFHLWTCMFKRTKEVRFEISKIHIKRRH